MKMLYTAPAGETFKRPAFVYVMSGGNRVKIGIAIDVDTRLNAIQMASPVLVKVEYTRGFKTKRDALLTERSVHAALEHCRAWGEWFDSTVEDAVAAIEAVGDCPEPVRMRARYTTRHKQPIGPKLPVLVERIPFRQSGKVPSFAELNAMDDDAWNAHMAPVMNHVLSF